MISSFCALTVDELCTHRLYDSKSHLRTCRMVVGADPGFSRRALIPKGGANLLLGQILLKLHENEDNCTGDASKIFHVDPPLVVVCIQKWTFALEI